MSEASTPILAPMLERQRKRQGPKGRRVEPEALAEVQRLLGDALRQRDLLIEHLRVIQDAHGHLCAAHLAALAQAMCLSMAEVYEVASFYHHVDGVKEGQATPPTLTVRVCDGLSVSCRVNSPGVKLAPAGITARQLIDRYCGGMLDGHAFHAYLPGGASGGILAARLGDIPLNFDTLQPHGCFIGSAAVIVLADRDSGLGQAVPNPIDCVIKYFPQELRT